MNSAAQVDRLVDLADLIFEIVTGSQYPVAIPAGALHRKVPPQPRRVERLLSLPGRCSGCSDLLPPAEIGRGGRDIGLVAVVANEDGGGGVDRPVSRSLRSINF